MKSNHKTFKNMNQFINNHIFVKMKKSLIFTVLMALAMSGFAQQYHFAATCESGQTLYYNTLNDHEVEITFPYNGDGGSWLTYPKPTGNLIIPSIVEHNGISYTVTSIGNRAFLECNQITSVEIPNTIVSIRSQAFYKANALTSLEIPNSVVLIGEYAFFSCNQLLSLTIGSSVSSIGENAFTSCINLQSIHCNTPTPPDPIFPTSNPNPEVFIWVPSNIPVYVSCLSINQFQLHSAWDQFTNLIGVFVGVPKLNIQCNNSSLGTVEIVSLPESCEDSTATVLATPNPGHVFSYWEKGIEMVSFSPEYTFVLDQNTTLTACFDSAPIEYDSIALPDHVIARQFDTDGQITNVFSSDFTYNANGHLTRYYFTQDLYTTYPNDLRTIVCDFAFVNFPDMLSGIHTDFYYTYDYDYRSESTLYSYDHKRIKNAMEYDHNGLIWAYNYNYDDNWRIQQIEKTNPNGTLMGLNLFEYTDNFRTKIETCYSGYPTMLLKTQTTKHYNERQQILSSQLDTYDNSGDISSRKKDTYSYTSNNKTDNIITQIFSDGEWTNSSIAHYVYDDIDRIVEYQTGSWIADSNAWIISKKIYYNFDDEEHVLTVSFRKKNAEGEWVWDVFNGQTVFYESELKVWQKVISYYKYYGINQFEIDLHYFIKEKEVGFPDQSEWFYTLEWDNGNITYQHLEYTADTTIGNERPKVIVRSNTHYDRDTITEVTHEYILETGNKVYWWNKDLEEFTMLYDYTAEADDEWEIKVGMESLTMHVDSVWHHEFEGRSYRILHVSDPDDLFSGDIVCGIGHLTSFFPERLMNRGKGYRVTGLRCYWVEGNLIFKITNDDCDAIYAELHNGVEENGPSTGSGAFAIYPNPANGVLFVRLPQCDSPTTEQIEYHITNLMGQTLLQGHIDTENQQIDISNLPAGMYFFSVSGETVKFVVK